MKFLSNKNAVENQLYSTTNRFNVNISENEKNLSGSTTDNSEFYYYYSEEMWNTNEVGELLIRSKKVTSKFMFLDVLLPSGFLIPIQCLIYRTLAQLKQDVFIQTKKLPPPGQLKNITNFIFSAIRLDNVRIELYDEQKPVSCLQSCLPMLELIEPEESLDDKILTQKISKLMGFSLIELERNLTEEMKLFRLELFDLCLKVEKERINFGINHYAFFCEPSIVGITVKKTLHSEIDEVHENDLDFVQDPEDCDELENRALDRLRGRLEFSGYYLKVWYTSNDEDNLEFTQSVKLKDIFNKTPDDLIVLALERLSDTYGFLIIEKPSDYILQIAGQRVFVVNNEYITQFQYIRSCFENYRIPHLLLRRKKTIFKQYPQSLPIFKPAYSRKREQNARLKPLSTHEQLSVQQQTRSFWDLDENLRLRVHSVSQMNVGDEDKVFVQVAVSIALHILDIQQTELVSSSNCRFLDGGLLEFNIYLKDLPEAAKFSFLLICVRAGRSQTKNDNFGGEVLGWTNCQIFDWRHRLSKGKHLFNFWPFPKSMQDKTFVLNSLDLFGKNLANPIASIEIEFARYKDDDIVYEFPSSDTIMKFHKIFNERKLNTNSKMCKSQINLNKGETNKNDFLVSENQENDDSKILLLPGSEALNKLLCLQRCLDSSNLSIEDQLFLWRLRYKIQKLFPQMIVVLADCAYIWKQRETACEFYVLLNNWPSLKVETALELLDFRFADYRLRTLAVENLDKKLNNDQFHLHLLTLVQAIRFESFAFSPLASMLIRRSILSYRIAHTTFWLLRAELAYLAGEQLYKNRISVLYCRYALMLEAICRSHSSYLDSIIKQVKMISTLTKLSAQVRLVNNKDLATKKLQQELEEKKDSLQFMDSPLNYTDYLGELIVKECRVLKSAKMPIRLTWRNTEPMADLATKTHQLIFKNGDDMRQDMLTLQVMKIMDSCWKSYNYDFCMTLYNVLPMGRNIGLIQVVQNCQTLFEIQCAARPATSSLNMDTNLLHKYLYQNYESTQYMERVERFRSSLAGYSVATYVIGIRDRHQDNIMVADDGRIFHIDFGHILGHTKRKLGINRERTEFILTEHFLCAIAHSRDYKKSHEFAKFRDICVKGFMIVHHHARFYISLFRMMLCMGLPELSSQQNVNFLKDSLMYNEMDRKKCNEAFQSIFDQAIRGDWSVCVNWFFHSVKHI